MTDYRKLAEVSNLYIRARKALKTINKDENPKLYRKCLELIATTGLILKNHGVKITL